MGATASTGTALDDADAELIGQAVAVAAELMVRAQQVRLRRERRQRERLQRLVASDGGTRLVFSLADRMLRPVDRRTAAAQLVQVTSGPLEGTTRTDRAMLRLGALASRVAPGSVVALARARLRHETRSLVLVTEPRALRRGLASLWSTRRRPNLNLLGEAVLGWEEATRRAGAVRSLLDRSDVDCVSVKVSSIAAGLSLVDYEGSVERVSEPLARLYRAALEYDPPKLVNLDMEEHRDLDLTLAVFMLVLDRPEFDGLTAGLALQAYLPDSHGALDRLLPWAAERHRRGAAPIRVRLVKGANLAMETVEAELRGWPVATYGSKAKTDASYKALLERLVAAAVTGSVHVGVASHNVFDLAFGMVLAQRAEVAVDVEMLAGMADDQAAAAVELAGRMLLYVPVTSRRDFKNALAYLARRLDENATPDGFLRHALTITPGTPDWEGQARRFGRAVEDRHAVSTSPSQHQDRRALLEVSLDQGPWVNEPDTDLTVPANREWARSTLAAERPNRPDAAGEDEVDGAIARARAAAWSWARTTAGERRRMLLDAATELAAGRSDAISVMAAEAGKTFAEADPEVSEAVDYARWYARELETLEPLLAEVASEPLGVVVVTPPWNFPFAIPAGGVLAALAAGNAVILKPSPEAPATAALLCAQLWSAGLPDGLLGLSAAPDGPAGRRLVAHPDVGAVVLTGSLDTARMFLGWAPQHRLLAETSGKNAMVVGATADVDLAVADLVRSAFGHAGQKCSAASLAIVEASVHDRSPFLRQLADATRSLRVGPASDPATEMGPIVGPFTPALERALTSLDPGESWLVEPRALDEVGRLWSPGVRLGVRPGSWAHQTEWFGPMLAVLRADGLDEALAIQNAVSFGLTAGLHSLDPVEHARWAEQVEAGNLYVNRPTTGALVGRQPFGGWKASSVGPTAKAGGPNYLLALRRWHDAEPTGVHEAEASYRHWWSSYFSQGHDVAGLRAEANVLRYRKFTPGVLLRVAGDDGAEDARKAAAAAAVTGTPLRVSVAPSLRGLAADLRRRGLDAECEEASVLEPRLASGARLRLVGGPEPATLAAAARAGVAVLDEPVCSHGRIELVRWLREQTLSRSLHRYGNVVY